MEKYKLIIVIGLPCSGKTTFCKKIKTHKLFDDFISKFFDGTLVECLDNNEKVIINDPRLCNFTHFERYIDLFEEIVDKNDISLILIENDLEFSLKNIGEKNSYKSIVYYSNIYNVNNYKKYNCIIYNGNPD